MIPTWQIGALLLFALVAIGLGIYSAPNSYGYLMITGQCRQEPMPLACHKRGLR